MNTKPKKISVSKSNATLSIEWMDGELSIYPLAGLRAACPCAQCKGGHANMGKPASPDMLDIPLLVNASIELKSIEKVGNYALQIVWGDGHSYGIYSWEFLRGLTHTHLPEIDVE